MEYLKIEEMAKLWGISPRRLQTLCAEGKIDGAQRFGRAWMIPKSALKPVDGRTKAGRAAQQSREEENLPLPRKTPFLYMSDLYRVPGTADEAAQSLSYHHEAQVLFEAELAYARGQIDKVYERAYYLLEKHSGFYAVISAGMLLALCAIWKGDLEMWRKAKVHMAEARAKDDQDRDIIALAITAADSMLYDVENFPEWFKMGNFEPLHKDSLPAARVYYAKYLYAAAYTLATGQMQLQGISGLTLMRLLPATIEPMISQAMADQSVISEVYLRLTCAVVYHSGGNDAQAIRHIDRAVALALPDKLYGLLAEYCRLLGSLLESRVTMVDKEAWGEINALFKVYVEGWSKLNSRVSGRQIIAKLSDQNRKVARLAAFKLSNAEIAQRMNMSLSGVKQAVRIISEKSGLTRDEFAAIL